MPLAVKIIGMLTGLAGLVALVHPTLQKRLAKRFHTPNMVYCAVAIRMTVGTFLIFAAVYCRPEYYSQQVVRGLGIITVASAFVIMLLGGNRMMRLLDWVLRQPNAFLRCCGLAAVAIGGYLIYASGV
jgi:uncharacterized protein YjeT (DUF2065 family)